MKEIIKNPEADAQPQSTENTEQQGETIYDFEEEKRKLEERQVEENDIVGKEKGEIARIQESLSPNKKTRIRNAFYSRGFQNAIDVFQSSDVKGRKKAIKKFEKVFDHAIMRGALDQETIMLYLVQAGANNMIQENSLSFYKKFAKLWPEINFVLNASREELQEINNKYALSKDLKGFSEYYWTNIYDENSEIVPIKRKRSLFSKLLGR